MFKLQKKKKFKKNHFFYFQIFLLQDERAPYIQANNIWDNAYYILPLLETGNNWS